MTLVHGVLLWCIIALSLYALNKGDCVISFGSASAVSPGEERIREVFNRINEQNVRNLTLIKKQIEDAQKAENSDTEHEDKSLK